MKMPYVMLNNGIVVGNFSSHHEFKFDDGTTLGGCSEKRCRTLMLTPNEIESTVIKRSGHKQISWSDIDLRFKMSDEVRRELDIAKGSCCDIIIVPLPVIKAIKDECGEIGKCRTCRVKDRVTKLLYSDRFCI